jgi:transcriptional regulator with XRE-family HTH domain
MSKIHEIIKAIRTAKGLKQEEVASKLSMAQSNYARLEKGLTQVTVERLQQLADVFEMSVTAMLTYEVGQNAPTREDIEYYIALCKKQEKQIEKLKGRNDELEEESNESFFDQRNAIKESEEKLRKQANAFKQKEKDYLERLQQKDEIIAEKNRTISILEMTVKALTKEPIS